MHEGHRARLIGKILNGDGLYEHELVEAILFSAFPRRDLNFLAHALLDKFECIEGLLEAEPEEICEVKGFGENAADYLKVMSLCYKRFGTATFFAEVKSTADFFAFLEERHRFATDERVELFLTDNQHRIKNACKFSVVNGKPGLDRGIVYDRIAEFKPYGVWAVHFIPAAQATPFKREDEIASFVAEACNGAQARLFDYCVKCGGGKFSYFTADRLERGVNGLDSRITANGE